MLTRRGYGSLIDRAKETGGLTPEMQEDLEKLRGELDERDGLLRKYGETYDGESEEEEWEFREREVPDYKAQYDALTAKYNGLSARYTDLMNNPHTAHETDASVDEGQGDYTDTDYDNIRISDLITTKED